MLQAPVAFGTGAERGRTRYCRSPSARTSPAWRAVEPWTSTSFTVAPGRKTRSCSQSSITRTSAPDGSRVTSGPSSNGYEFASLTTRSSHPWPATRPGRMPEGRRRATSRMSSPPGRNSLRPATVRTAPARACRSPLSSLARWLCPAMCPILRPTVVPRFGRPQPTVAMVVSIKGSRVDRVDDGRASPLRSIVQG